MIILYIDKPTNIFGRICVWCGYIILQQSEIKENINGLLKDAIDLSRFGISDKKLDS